MKFLDLIKSTGYITVSKELAKEIGLNETIILSELISQYEYFKKNNQLKDKEWFYCTIEKLKEQTTLNRYYQNKAIDNLKDLGLIEVERKGLPAKRYFKIVESKIIKLFYDKNDDNPRNDQIENISQTRMLQSNNQDSNSVTNINNNNYNKTEEEESIEIPQRIQLKFQQIFNRKLSNEFYQEITEIYLNPDIILKALSICEKQADKPGYLLVILKDWKNNKLTSVTKVNLYLENRQAQKEAKQSKKENTATRPETPKEELQMLYEEGYR